MKKYTVSTIIGVVILGGALYALLHLNSKSLTPNPSPIISSESSATTTSTNTYRNSTYGFILAYPNELQQKEYGQNDVVFGHITGTGAAEKVDGVAEAQVMIVQGLAGETFGQAATRELKNLCSADGPTTTFSCTGVENIKPFPSASGTLGLEFYLKGELKTLKTGTITPIEKGPYFAYSLKTGTTGSSVLVIHPPLNQSAAEAATTTVEAIAKSVKFDAAQDGDFLLRAYISENLAKLSPVKASLGGTFYVTRIDAKDGKGTVYYEDGRSAYVADFTYSTSKAGTMTVTTFKLRK